MDGNDVGVIEAGDSAGFGQVGFGDLRAGRQIAVRHLDGDQTLQLLIVGQVDDAEAALCPGASPRGSGRSAAAGSARGVCAEDAIGGIVLSGSDLRVRSWAILSRVFVQVECPGSIILASAFWSAAIHRRFSFFLF